MIYEAPGREQPIDQGDIIADCPVLRVARFDAAGVVAADPASLQTSHEFGRVIVLTQTCDLANEKTTTALVARMHDAAELVRSGVLRTADVRGPIRGGRVFGWYFLPADAGHGLPESLIDFR